MTERSDSFYENGMWFGLGICAGALLFLVLGHLLVWLVTL